MDYRTLRFIFIPLLALLLAACGSPAETSQTSTGSPRLQLEDCQLAAPGQPTRQAARCGRLTVPEDRASPSGRQIDLKIAMIPAVSRSPEPDPLFFLTGGPGQAATESYLSLSFAFERINQKRDIILVDQRGTGGSNPLVCPEQEDSDELEAPNDEQLAEWLESCLKALDADPRFYTTSVAMQDLDEVRVALGFDIINLYGLSYGTRAALTYMQQYPDRVRSVILDGVIPQDETLGLDVARDAQRALDQIFARCAADFNCAQAFPDIQAEFESLLSRLRDQPVRLSIPEPLSGEPVELDFTAENLAVAVRLLSYTPETAALLPYVIHTALETGDFALLGSQYLIVSTQLVETISVGMNYSVLCAEDVPLIDFEAARLADLDTYLGTQQTDELVRICQTWPQGKTPPGFREPIRSEVPVLILSGEADPVTPPENGEKVAETLPNSLHLVAPGQGHNVIYRGCLPEIAADFIASGSVSGLEAACVEAIEPMPFFINPSGPTP